MARIFACLLTLFFCLSGSAMERSADFWRYSLAAKTETAIAYRAINPAYAESTAQSGQFFRSGAAGRLGNDNINSIKKSEQNAKRQLRDIANDPSLADEL